MIQEGWETYLNNPECDDHVITVYGDWLDENGGDGEGWRRLAKSGYRPMRFGLPIPKEFNPSLGDDVKDPYSWYPEEYLVYTHMDRLSILPQEVFTNLAGYLPLEGHEGRYYVTRYDALNALVNVLVEGVTV